MILWFKLQYIQGIIYLFIYLFSKATVDNNLHVFVLYVDWRDIFKHKTISVEYWQIKILIFYILKRHASFVFRWQLNSYNS